MVDNGVGAGGHVVTTFVSVRRGAQMTKEERSSVNTMQRNGPLWWDGLTPGNVVAHPRSHPLRPRQTHLHASIARVDGAGQPVPGSFDRHSCLEGISNDNNTSHRLGHLSCLRLWAALPGPHGLPHASWLSVADHSGHCRFMQTCRGNGQSSWD